MEKSLLLSSFAFFLQLINLSVIVCCAVFSAIDKIELTLLCRAGAYNINLFLKLQCWQETRYYNSILYCFRHQSYTFPGSLVLYLETHVIK